MVPLEDLEVLEALEDRIGLEEAAAALAGVETDGMLPVSTVKAELSL